MGNCNNSVGFFEMGSKRMIKARCNRWDCKDCGPIKKNKLLDRVKKGLKEQRIRFLTLTVSDKTFVCDDKKIKVYWANLRKWLSKERWYMKDESGMPPENIIKLSKSRNINDRIKANNYLEENCIRICYMRMLYFWTMEFTKKGYRHMHVMLNKYIPQKVLQYAWWKVTGMCNYYKVNQIHMDIRGTDDNPIRNPAGYMAKYLNKAYSSDRFEGKERRYGFSRSYRFKSERYFYDEYVYVLNNDISARRKKLDQKTINEYKRYNEHGYIPTLGEFGKSYCQFRVKFKNTWVLNLANKYKPKDEKAVIPKKIEIDEDCQYYNSIKNVCGCRYECKNFACRKAINNVYVKVDGAKISKYDVEQNNLSEMIY